MDYERAEKGIIDERTGVSVGDRVRLTGKGSNRAVDGDVGTVLEVGVPAEILGFPLMVWVEIDRLIPERKIKLYDDTSRFEIFEKKEVLWMPGKPEYSLWTLGVDDESVEGSGAGVADITYHYLDDRTDLLACVSKAQEMALAYKRETFQIRDEKGKVIYWTGERGTIPLPFTPTKEEEMEFEIVEAGAPVAKATSKAPAARKPRARKTPMPTCWKDAEAILKSGARRVLLRGIPGTGKTYAARTVGVSKKRVYNIYIQPETPAVDVLGHDIITAGEMPWRDGPALLAWRQGARLVVNEIDKASEDCLTALLAICDDPESAGIVMPTGEHVEPHPDFQVVATMNGDYDDLPEPLRERFSVSVDVTHPHPSAIDALPANMRQLARTTTHAGIPEQQRLSIRQFRALDELLKRKVPEDVAMRGAFQHRAQDVTLALKAGTLAGLEALADPEEEF